MSHLARSTARTIVLVFVVVLASGCMVRGPGHLRLDASQLAIARATTLITRDQRAPRFEPVIASKEESRTQPASQPLEIFERKGLHVAPPHEGAPGRAEQEGSTARSCPRDSTRVLLVGDSLSHGLGPAVRPHARRCGTAYSHHGVIGSHVTEWGQDAWLGAQLERVRPTIVVMSMGGNDFQRFDPERVKAAIERVVARVEASGARFLWISPPTMPFDDRIDVRGMWSKTLSRHPAAAIFPTHTLTIPRVEDRVHPTQSANRDLARRLWLWIVRQSFSLELSSPPEGKRS